ncbi:MAG: DUF29 domain-containing protein [Deltaproteobacteria bacterium]|nr:DUF29 domain-containing protein [Deltaproteobacteria bacterium]
MGMLYNSDFHAWTQEQAALLKSGRLSDVDINNLIEEIESMGKNERRELKSRLVILIMHLLKWQMQPERQSNSWKATIETQRFQILELLEDSPSLKRELEAFVNAAYPKAKRLAILETGLIRDSFPPECAYDVDDILREGFYP